MPSLSPPRRKQITFSDDRLAAALQTASRETLNRMEFGVIRVDDRGPGRDYTRFESRLFGHGAENTSRACFFDEVVLSGRTRRIPTRFEQGLETGHLDTTFSCPFAYRLRPILVEVRLLVRRPERGWIVVRSAARPTP